MCAAMLLSMKTVQRSPRLAGCEPVSAVGPISSRGTPSFLACSSIKEPVPAAQILFIWKSVDNAVFNGNELGVLAADFENGVHGRVKRHGGPGLGRDFVAHHVGPHQAADHVSARPGGGGPGDSHGVAEFLLQLDQAGAHGVDRIARSPQVAETDDLVVSVHQGQVGAGGPDVDAEPAGLGSCLCERMRRVFALCVTLAQAVERLEIRILMQVDVLAGPVRDCVRCRLDIDGCLFLCRQDRRARGPRPGLNAF